MSMKYSYLVIYFVFMIIIISDLPKINSYFEVFLVYFFIVFIVHISCYFYGDKYQFQDVPSIYGITVWLVMVLDGRDVIVLNYSNLFLYLAIFSVYIIMACGYLSYKIGFLEFYYDFKSGARFILGSTVLIILSIVVYSFISDFRYDLFLSLVVVPVILFFTFYFVSHVIFKRLRLA